MRMGTARGEAGTPATAVVWSLDWSVVVRSGAPRPLSVTVTPQRRAGGVPVVPQNRYLRPARHTASYSAGSPPGVGRPSGTDVLRDVRSRAGSGLGVISDVMFSCYRERR